MDHRVRQRGPVLVRVPAETIDGGDRRTFWARGYFASTVGPDEQVIREVHPEVRRKPTRDWIDWASGVNGPPVRSSTTVGPRKRPG